MTDNEFNRISEQYIDIVYRSAINICKNKSDAEDAVQNTFLKLLKSDIDFENEDHIRRWLIRVAVNECKNITFTVDIMIISIYHTKHIRIV